MEVLFKYIIGSRGRGVSGVQWKKFILTVLFSLFLSANASASVIISEFLADPSNVALNGDANGDGNNSTSQDEFVELINKGSNPVNISGWKLLDAIKVRHVFPNNTIIADGEYFVVFGGGSIALPGISGQTASRGGLGLNNSGDMISLYNALDQLVDEVTYGSEGGDNQSLVRWPQEPGSPFVQHSGVSSSGALFSPGTAVNGQKRSAAVPEVSSLFGFAMGLLGLIRKRFQGHKDTKTQVIAGLIPVTWCLCVPVTLIY